MRTTCDFSGSSNRQLDQRNRSRRCFPRTGVARRAVRAALSCGILLQLCCLPLAGQERRADHVFIISFDQGNPDLMETVDLPVFDQMMREGAHAREAFTIVPSSTLPAHASMLTGVGIQKHQVLWNDYRPERGPVQVPTIFKLAKEQGLVTAAFVSKEKLKHLDQPGSLDVFVRPQPEDDAGAVANAFAEQVGQLKPNLCFIHFRDPDTEGHKHGADAPEKIQALKHCDEALATIKDAVATAGLLDRSVFILTADHGAHNATTDEGSVVGVHGSAATEDVRIPWVVWGEGVTQGFTVPEPVLQYDTAATALWLLNIPRPQHLWGRPVTNAFDKAMAPESES